MPIPKPKKYEREKEFIYSRCVPSKIMKKEFPNIKQRIAVCYSKIKNKR